MKNEVIQQLNNSVRELVKSHDNLSGNYFSVATIVLTTAETKLSAGKVAFDLVVGGIIGGLTQGLDVGLGSDWWSTEECDAVLTVNQENLAFYVLKDENKDGKYELESGNIYNAKNLKTVFVIPFSKIVKIKIKNFLGYTVKIFCGHEGQSSKIKFNVFKRKQKEEVEKLINHLKKLRKELKQK